MTVRWSFRALLVLCFSWLLQLSATVNGSPLASAVVISQIYGGGGNPGATYTHDFVELFNRSAAPVNLSGWSVQYTSATGTTWSATLLAGTIQPGQYFLVQMASGAGGTTPLPTPDVIGNSNLGAISAKLALVNSAVVLSGACPADSTIQDFVGYGSSASCFEGSGPAPSLTNVQAAQRNQNGCQDSDNNVADFVAAAPDPHNSASPLLPCATPTAVTGGSTSAGGGSARWALIVAGLMGLSTLRYALKRRQG